MHDIESKIKKIVSTSLTDEFIFDFLLAYNVPKSLIKRARGWDLNQLDEKWEFTIRKKVFFKYSSDNLYSTLDDLKKSFEKVKNKPRFIIVTNFKEFLSYDTKTWDPLDITFEKLDKSYDFFLPLVWIEKQQYQNENIADVKAATNLAKLFDEIRKTNKPETDEQRHALNIFLSRLLFCYFAEDTKIFTVNQFTDSLASHTKTDWSDTHIFLKNLFEIFNTENRDSSVLEYLTIFPYVNGKLFQDDYAIPTFTTKSRNLLIELWKLDWSSINPDIFWSMMQAVMNEEERWNMWSHYTSVPNIMKVIKPLFLDDLYEAFEACEWKEKKLVELLRRIEKIKFFDPACWSGNFLIIAYKEIRRLEIEIFKEIWVWGPLVFSGIKLSQFYGIELHDFAHETAKLSLYLAEHQMNVEFFKETWVSTKSLPLKLWGNIICGNAARIDWEDVCPKKEWDETYIMGNPPYIWYSDRWTSQKEDMKIVFEWFSNVNRLDYIACWFKKATDYISQSDSSYSFVSTNSITQWEQVSLIRPYIFSKNQEIYFAFKSFKWTNNAKWKAWVTVVIIWIRNQQKDNKYLFENNIKTKVNNISPYLTTNSNIIMKQRKDSLSWFPDMKLWSSWIDGWHLILSQSEKELFLKNDIESSQYIKPFIWWADLLRWTQRYCLWIEDDKVKKAMSINMIKERIDKCREYRLSWWRDAKKAANVPHRFFYRKYENTNAIVLPMTSSSRREIIPVWFLKKGYIISNWVFVIYDRSVYMLGILSSKLHYLWLRTTSARMRNDFRYSVNLTYKTFPFPYITKKQKIEIEEYVYHILDERERHSEKTLAQLYDPDMMPEWLKDAHHQLDLAIERCYRLKPFESDEERLEYLFKMYEKMIAKEQESAS